MTQRTRMAGSQSATHVVQYLTREGRYAVFPEDDVRYMTRTSDATHDRGDLRHVEVGNLPAWAKGDAGVFFEAAYQGEERQARYATAIQMSLPRELTHAQQIALARDFMEVHCHNKPYLFVKHEPIAKDGGLQPHIHVLLSTRMEDGIPRGPTQFFKRYNRQHPEKGGAQKDVFWKERRAPEKLRESWAILTNVHLERAGVAARVDPRELRVQGIQRIPGTKWGGSAEPRDLRKEEAAAEMWWSAKKRAVGLTEENLIVAVRTQARQGNPGHYPTREEVGQNLREVQAHGQALDAERRILTRAIDRPGPSRRLGQGREEHVGGPGLRVKLQEEYEYGRGR